MHMISVDRTSIDRHLVGTGDFPQQLPCALSNVPGQDRITVFRDPDQMILAVPNRVTAALVVLHSGRIASQSPKGEGFTDPL